MKCSLLAIPNFESARCSHEKIDHCTWQASEGEGKRKDERVKREKMGRGRIARLSSFLPLRTPATQASFVFPPSLLKCT